MLHNGRRLPPCHNTVLIEHVQPHRSAPEARVVLFDFDGTLSLIRSGWMDIMLDMMMETLGPLGALSNTDPKMLRNAAEEYVARLTGQDTVYQMAAFVDHVRSLGGEPSPPEEYKAEFLVRLQAVRGERVHALEAGLRTQESLLVPGSFEILDQLQSRDLELYLSSGTDHQALRTEAELLGLTPYFGANIFGAGSGGSTKAGLLRRIAEQGTPVDRIVFFGDGQVEIAATKDIGGLAVGLATDEPECLEVDPKKRVWLMGAGADFIVPNYLDAGLVEAVIPHA